MKMINAIISDLVEKRLWPVAAILVVMVVGVPMMLSRPGASPEPEIVPTANVQTDDGPQLALSRTATTGFARAPRVNKKELDPFADRTEKKTDALVKQVKDQLSNALGSSSDVTNPGTGDGVGGGSVGGGDTGGSSDPKPTKTPKPTTPETETDDVLAVVITQGEDVKELDDIRTLSPLPDAENPFLVYVGKTGSGGASFLVSADVVPTGDGVCDPSPQDCRTLTMKSGDTESFKLLDGTVIEITMVGVDTKKVPVTGTAARAARLEAKARAVGASALRSVMDDKKVLYSLGKQKVKFRF